MAYLHEYLNRIRDVYNKARVEYTKIMDRREDEEQRYRKLMKSGELNARGIERAKERHSETIAQINREFEALMQGTEETFSQIRTAVKFTFRDMYGLNPDKIDMNTLELLKSGIMTNDELTELAGNFEKNPTMRRMIGKYVSERSAKDPANDELRMLAAKCSVVDGTPHLDAVDALIGWSRSGLREDRMLADKIAEVYDQETAPIFKDYGNLYIDR